MTELICPKCLYKFDYDYTDSDYTESDHYAECPKCNTMIRVNVEIEILYSRDEDDFAYRFLKVRGYPSLDDVWTDDRRRMMLSHYINCIVIEGIMERDSVMDGYDRAVSEWAFQEAMRYSKKEPVEDETGPSDWMDMFKDPDIAAKVEREIRKKRASMDPTEGLRNIG